MRAFYLSPADPIALQNNNMYNKKKTTKKKNLTKHIFF